MNIVIKRLQLDPDVTIGRLTIDGHAFHCYTLEDTVRPDGIKIHGETAIPAGRYNVDLTMSPRFGRVLPLLMNVGGFVGVRIHPGNTASDTEGCILVGIDRMPKAIGRSRIAFDALFGLMQEAKAQGHAIDVEVS